MTRIDLNRIGFVSHFSPASIQAISYKEYLDEHGTDWCTSPLGVRNRFFIKEVEGEELFEYEIWSWGTRGCNPYFTGDKFYDEQEATLDIYRRKEMYVCDSYSAPLWHTKYEDAVMEIAEVRCRSKEAVERFLSISKVATEKKEAADFIKKQYDAYRKENLNSLVDQEAASIMIDEEFQQDIEWINKASGKQKSDRMIIAIRELLTRNGKSEIKSDFWKVARILKAKAARQCA